MQELATRQSTVSADLQEKVLLGGDLARLTPAERLSYYNAVCNSVGLNPLTRPFEYLALNGKLVLYARKDCTDQLRDLHGISIQIVGREVVDGCYCVTAQGKNMTERTDESLGAVPLPTSPADKANAMMKAETKAKRRVTLSICGLGMLDETEIETIAGAHPIPSPTIPGAPADVVKLVKRATVEPVQQASSVLEPTTEEVLKDFVKQAGVGPATHTMTVPPEDRYPVDNPFEQSSAIAEHEVALRECAAISVKQMAIDQLKVTWDHVVKDKRLSSETRPPLYQLMKKIEKEIRARR